MLIIVFQEQFNVFILGLRQQYGSKVNTFKQVIEVHRKELMIKEKYWDDAIKVKYFEQYH